jgi:hypothetical protein
MLTMGTLNPSAAGPTSFLAPGAAAQGYSTSGFFPPTLTNVVLEDQQIAADFLFAFPFFARGSHAFTGMSFYQSNAAVTGNIRLGLYVNTNGRPGARFQDVGAVAAPGSTGWRTAAATINLVEGTWYWMALVADAAIHGYGIDITSNAQAPMMHYSSWQEFGALATGAPAGEGRVGVKGTHVYAALPDPFPTITDYVGGNFHIIPWLKG